MLLAEQRISSDDLDKLDDQYEGRIVHAWQDPLPRRNGKEAPKGAVAWECVFRAPNRRELALFAQQTDAAASPATRSKAADMLAMTCVIHVSGGAKGNAREDFDALLETWPGIPARVATALGKIAGFEAEQVEKG